MSLQLKIKYKLFTCLRHQIRRTELHKHVALQRWPPAQGVWQQVVRALPLSLALFPGKARSDMPLPPAFCNVCVPAASAHARLAACRVAASFRTRT